MKKALALVSALALASAAQSDGFLADNDLRIRPISYNPNEDFPLEDFPQVFPRKFPPIVYADDEQYVSADDDEQYVGFNLVQNWHYPLKPIPRPNPYVQSQPKIEEDSAENVLFDLGKALQKGMEVYQKGQEVFQKKNEVRRIKSHHDGHSAKKDADEENPVLPTYQRQRR